MNSFIIDRDPGDETAAVPVPRCRSYRATYKVKDRWNGIHFRDFIGPDDFLHAVELAEAHRADNERLLNVKELS